MRINTNVASMTAQESAANVNKALNSSLEKLSSGLRINKASDDASGMAIADKLRTQASSLGQSISNANSAGALVQIADKAMAEQSNILDIVKTKLIQAATETTSAEGRESIRKDVQKLLQQLDNIASQTNYNGINLLNEKDKSFVFQVGEDKDYDISISTAYAANTSGLGATSEVLTNADAVMNYEGAVSLKEDGATLNVKDGVTAAGSKSVVVTAGATGDSSFKIENATNVTSIAVGTSGGVITFSTTDEALISALDGIDAADGDLVRNSAGNYTFKAASDGDKIDFGSVGIDISNLTISGMNATSDGAVTIKTDNALDITKVSGSAALSVDAQTANGLEGPGVATNNIGYTIAGVTIDTGAAAIKADSTAVSAGSFAGVSVTSAAANGNYTASADNVTKMTLTSGQSVTLLANDEVTKAKLEELSATDTDLVKLSEGTYTFGNSSALSVLDFGSEGLDISGLEVVGVAAAAVVTFQTDEAVTVEKNGSSASPDIKLIGQSITSAGVGTAITSTSATPDGVSISGALSGLKNITELTAEKANEYMAIVDTALNQLNTVRSDFGSTQNQLDSFVRNAMTTQTNIKAAESVIRDVDYAAESANFNKQNIIAQAGTYAMSQANTIQQNVLRLLQ